MLPSFYRISGNMFVINTGSTGPDLVVLFLLWILESSKIHIKSIAIGPESLISHLGMLKTHRDPKKQYKKTKSLTLLNPIGAFRLECSMHLITKIARWVAVSGRIKNGEGVDRVWYVVTTYK